MIHLARISVKHPLISLFVALVVTAALGVVGVGVTDSLSPTRTTVAGSSSARAEHLAKSQFGPSVLVPILLEGPKAQLDRQGPALVRVLAARKDTRVLSAWDSGDAGKQLRPNPQAAMVLAAVARSEDVMVNRVQGQIDRTVASTIASPVRATITGTPSLDRAMKNRAIDATRTGMALTIPLLFLVLLLVLRAPVAAAALSVLGAGTAFASLGLMALAGKVVAVDAVAVTTACMIGMALGVGYGLLVFHRWRNELGDGTTHEDAVHASLAAVATTGRAVLVGGTALIVALLIAPTIADTTILTSIGVGSLLCSALGVGAAVVVMPAFLTLAGRRAEALSFGAPSALTRGWDHLVGGGNAVTRHGITTGAAATAALVALALPLIFLNTGPPSPKLLPATDRARVSFEHVADVMGAGWPTPYNIVLLSPSKPITDGVLLRKIDRFQTSLAKDSRIASVAGPGVFAATSKDLGVLPKQLKSSAKLIKGGKKNLGKLATGLGQAADGVKQLRSGLIAASSGAGQLQSGSGTAQGGAGQLHSGLAQATDGASQISGGLQTALDAARQLHDGAGAALAGSSQITNGLGQAAGPLKQGVPVVKGLADQVSSGSTSVASAASTAGALSAQLDDAAASVSGLPASNERSAALAAIASARNAAGGLSTTLNGSATTLSSAASVARLFSDQTSQLSAGLSQLYAGSQALQTGIGRLEDGNGQLAAGIAKLSGGGSQLTAGVTKLRDGAGQLEAGLGQLTGGAGQLASGLSSGVGPSGRLVSGLGTAHNKVAEFRSSLPSTKDLERLQSQSPGLFDSGYFVLAAIAGATPGQRNQASFAVDLNGGGNAGQITIIPRYGISSVATQQLGRDLQRRVQAFAAANKLDAAVGGPAGSLGDFRTETASRIWPVVIITAAVVALLMMMMLQAVVLPLVAVAFDLLTTAATLGVLTLLFDGRFPTLGGPGYIDPMSIIGIFSVVFGLSMVYEVQLLHATRERLLAGEDAHSALRHALRGSAGAATGAAVAMIVAVVPFAVTGLITVREFGVGVAVAIALDAFVVRPVLLPAAVAVLGERAWWPTRHARGTRSTPPPPLTQSPLSGGVA